MKKLIVGIFVFNLLLFSCNNKKIEQNDSDQMSDDNVIEFDIWPSKNHLELLFDYNGDNYKINFYGKEKTMAIAMIMVNEEVYDYYNDIVLSNEDVYIIREELKNPEIAKLINQIDENKMIINIKYIELHTDWIKESITNFDDKFGENKELIIVASDRLKDFLVNRLLYIYSLPLYTVQNNDTLIDICLKFFGDTDYERIVDVNPSMKWPNQYLVVHPNRKIRIPKK
jgi:hypothetical protein